MQSFFSFLKSKFISKLKVRGEASVVFGNILSFNLLGAYCHRSKLEWFAQFMNLKTTKRTLAWKKVYTIRLYGCEQCNVIGPVNQWPLWMCLRPSSHANPSLSPYTTIQASCWTGANVAVARAPVALENVVEWPWIVGKTIDKPMIWLCCYKYY